MKTTPRFSGLTTQGDLSFKNDSPPRRAFTLVELLVVISIIALLVSMLLPALGRARSLTERTVCAANQRQLFIAVDSYANEYKQLCPTFSNTLLQIDGGYAQWNGSTLTYGTSAYGYLLNNYCTSYKLGMCPAQRRQIANLPSAAYWYQYTLNNSVNVQGYASYVYFPNTTLTWQNYTIVGYDGLKSAWKLDEPGTTVFGGPNYLEQRDLFPFNQTVIFADQIGIIAGDATSNAAYPKTCHLETRKPAGGNITLGDGSVAWRGFDPYQWYGATGVANLGGFLPRQWSFDQISNPAYWGTDYFMP
jgi:prepilin-type N-terminal cleavage/methylation domain-containing protein